MLQTFWKLTYVHGMLTIDEPYFLHASFGESVILARLHLAIVSPIILQVSPIQYAQMNSQGQDPLYRPSTEHLTLCLTHSAVTVRFMAKFANNYDTLADSTMSWTSFANSQCRWVCCAYLILRSRYDGDTYFAEMSRSVDHNPFELFSELPLHY